MTHDFTPVPAKDLVERLSPTLQAAALNLHSQFRTFFLTVRDRRAAGQPGVARSHARQADARLRDLEDLVMAAFHVEGPEIEAQNWERRKGGKVRS
ncbi:hypothetical protein CFR73_12875 [Novacetimonas maltaceti]|uniref:Uncharacterized protein n=1 Tax=Novacetimonas maltaceti TaxID=1203393 RepID=A0A2S3VZY3_9PROT|nr:hypothetical protein [Novacetimonas maltaceti]POF62185.1 hypothetical protein KMAL_21990 [Novacetimonas maltaceti]PYD59217.1 hypothetical protein CFR73_12875 [Novacetimonas maltaceti]BCZ75943.1 hypothetical protein [Komagataeibacter phage phiKM1]